MFTSADFGFSDPLDSGNPDQLSEVIFNQLPGSGTLTFDGVVVTTGQAISATDIDAGKLKYTPPANSAGLPLTTIDFSVVDTGSTASGGQTTDQTPNTITINVDSINDAPEGEDKTQPLLEDQFHTCLLYTSDAADE